MDRSIGFEIKKWGDYFIDYFMIENSVINNHINSVKSAVMKIKSNQFIFRHFYKIPSINKKTDLKGVSVFGNNKWKSKCNKILNNCI